MSVQQMASQHETAAANTAPLLAQHTACNTTQPAATSLHRLPHNLLELVLQHLSLAEQLSHTTHISKQCATPTAVSLRYTTLLLDDDTVWHISHSSRLLALLSTVPSVILQLNTVPQKSHALQFIARPPNVDTLFPHLAHFSFRLSALASADATRRMNGLADEPLSMLPLLPYLSARSATLRSLHISQCVHRIRYDETLTAELLPLLASFTALQRLCLAGMVLWSEQLPLLLALPLDTLDLSTTTVDTRDHDAQPPSIASVAGCALLRTCRILRLPRILYLPSAWMDYVDAVVVARTDSDRPHTLTVHHRLGAAAAQQLFDLPPARSLSVAFSAVDADEDAFFSHAAASPTTRLPHRLRVVVDCPQYVPSSMTPFVSFVAVHHACIRSLTNAVLPRSRAVSAVVLAAVSRCANLHELQLAGMEEKRRQKGYEAEAPRWAEQARLDQLHTLKLTGLRDEQQSLCRLIAICPALRVCTLDCVDGSVGMLSALATSLATSCPLLSHLQLLGITHDSELSLPVLASDERVPPTPFRSLVRLDLHYTHWFQQQPSPLAKLHPFLVHSPLRRLTLALQCEVAYGAAVTALLEAVPGLEKLRVGTGQWTVMIEEPTGWQVWDDEEDEEADEKRQTVATCVVPVNRPVPVSDPPPSALDTLDLLLSPTFLSINHLVALLTHCPALTSIRLTISYKRDSLLHFLHCLAHIGRHCPSIADITFHLEAAGERPVWGQPLPEVTVRVVHVDEARDVVDTYELPAHAFAHLQSMRQVGDVREVLNEESAQYVRQQWFSAVRGAAIFDWHTLPLPAWARCDEIHR